MAALTKLFILFSFAIALNGCNTTNEFKDNIMTDKAQYIKDILSADSADLEEVLLSIKEKELIVENINDNFDEKTTF